MANYHMVREARMPAILVECGFMTHRREVELLKSEAYQRKSATAIVEGMAAVYGLRQKREEVSSMPSMPGQFKDVPTTHWAASAIAAAVEAGVIKGYDDGTFRPEQPVTRAELAVIVARMLQK